MTVARNKMTKRWMRDASDDWAVHNGCWFDEGIGQWVVDWMRRYLRLYEDEYAGQPFECVDDWQYEFVMRLFGWQRHDEEWLNCNKGNIRRFRKASIWVPKKNKKSPTLAATTVYVAFGDGVMGQKCFPTAKDGNQIRQNVMQHIFAMIEQSEELASQCQTNKTHASVYKPSSRSIIMPLSSDNIRTQKSNEGLNGSIFVDEVHVVDRAHIKRIDRAGISRPEPLHVEMSTVGDDLESYGYSRFRTAEGIIRGTVRTDETLAMVFGMPQDTKDEVIHNDPERAGKIANPAWGHTIKRREFLNDYEESKRTPAEFGKFKMYRLNIWQQSASPWVSVHDWRACPATEMDDYDAVTFGGLDLSRTKDFTAWVLFQPGDIPKCRGRYWVPDARVRELEAQFEIPITQWANDGWVHISSGSTIDYEHIRNQIKQDAEDFRQLRCVGYDAYNASDTSAYCSDQLGLEMVTVRQGVQSMSAPSKRLEELILDHNIDHCGDPVLEWMLGNVEMKYDDNENIKPKKVVGGTQKHIDGIVALIMSIFAWLDNPPAKKPTGFVGVA